MSRRLKTVRQFAESNPAFSEASLRWHIANSQKNRLAEAGAILRNGRRVLIDVDRFFEWLDRRQQSEA